MRWVGFLTRLRSTGLPIARVRQYVELARAGKTIPDRLELLLIHRITVAAQLAEMAGSVDAIDFTSATYQGRTPTE